MKTITALIIGTLAANMCLAETPLKNLMVWDIKKGQKETTTKFRSRRFTCQSPWKIECRTRIARRNGHLIIRVFRNDEAVPFVEAIRIIEGGIRPGSATIEEAGTFFVEIDAKTEWWWAKVNVPEQAEARRVPSRALAAEITFGLSVFRMAQRMYRAQHGRYTNLAALEAAGLTAKTDFQDMWFVAYGDYSIRLIDRDHYLLEWKRPAPESGRAIVDYPHATVIIDVAGVIRRDVTKQPEARGLPNRALAAEITSGLSVFRVAERMYRAEHGRYTNLASLEAAGLTAKTDFQDMWFVAYGDYSMPLIGEDHYLVEWKRPAPESGRAIVDYPHAAVTMDEAGLIRPDVTKQAEARGVPNRALAAEITSGLSVFRVAERMYRAEHGRYTNLASLEAAGLTAKTDFQDMWFVAYGDYSISLIDEEHYLVEWKRPAPESGRPIVDYPHATVTMDEAGVIRPDVMKQPEARRLPPGALAAEITSGLSVFRIAERMYRAEHGRYTNLAALEAAGLTAKTDFQHMRFIAYGDYSIRLIDGDHFAVEWKRPAPESGRAIVNYPHATVTMDEARVITRAD